jgi:hypothetical protein
MASQEELDRERELLDLQTQRAGIDQDILETQQNISNDLNNQIRLLGYEKAEKSEIRSLTRQVNKIASESYALSLNELGTSKNLVKVSKDRQTLDTSLNRLLAQRNIFANKSGELNERITESLDDQIRQILEIDEALNEVEKTSSKINENFGAKAFAGIEDISKSIPGLRQFSKPFSEAANEARKIAASGGSGAKAFAAGATSLASAAKSALPLLILTEVVKAVMQLDTGIGKVAKQLGISYQQSRLLNKELNDAANSSASLFVTNESIRESFLQINSALGTNARLNDELLVTQTELVKQAGYSVETASQLSTLSLATGKSSKDITTEFLGQAKALNIQNDLALNEKQLLESIAKISKGTLATFSSQPKELAKAVFEAKKLGLEIAQVERIADGLLDIEQSLTAEFEAEVISGKQLNLERARFFALTNDIAGVSEELGKQGITQAYFAKASRIEQQSIAGAMGMSRDEMGEMLIQQSALSKLQGIEGKTAQERFNRLVQEVGLEEAKNRLGDETLANQLASVSAQERFQQTITKLRDTFVGLVEPLLPVLDIFAGIASFVAEIVGFLSPMIPALMLIGGILTFNPLLIGAGVIGVGNQLVSDGIAPSSKGPFTITDSYGATAITAKGDGLAVSPNIIQEKSINTISNNINNTNNRNSSQNVTVTLSKEDIKSIADAVKDGASKANINVNLDGNRVSNTLQTPLAMNTRRYSV